MAFWLLPDNLVQPFSASPSLPFIPAALLSNLQSLALFADMRAALGHDDALNRRAATWAGSPCPPKHLQMIRIAAPRPAKRVKIVSAIAQSGSGILNSLAQNTANACMQGGDLSDLKITGTTHRMDPGGP
jgi:hypothetical protein